MLNAEFGLSDEYLVMFVIPMPMAKGLSNGFIPSEQPKFVPDHSVLKLMFFINSYDILPNMAVP